MSNNIENLLKQIENGDDLTEIELHKFSNDLLHNESSNDACRVFLVLFNKQKSLSDENYKRICNIIIEKHEKPARENAIRIIDLLIKSERNASDSCLEAIEIALQDQQSNILRIYASRILYAIIQKQHLSVSLLNVIPSALNDTSTHVQNYILETLKELIQKQPSVISQEIIDSMELYLSKIYLDINENYDKCVFITLFFLDLIYRQHKLNENLLKIFSKFLIIDVPKKKDRVLNCQASKLLQQVIAKQLIYEDLPKEVLVNLSKCFNLKSFENKQLFEYCLKILYILNNNQLKLTQLNGNLLKIYLKDTNFDDNIRSHLRILFGNLCKISYVYFDDENSKSIIGDTIDILIEGLDQNRFLQSSIYALKNIVLIDNSYLSIYPLQKFVLILNQDNLDKEIRQNACLILQLAIQKQLIITHNEIDGLENALNDSDSTLSLTALQALQYLFKNYYRDTDLIGSHVNKICTFSIDLISNSNLIFTSNASKLLEIVLEYDLKTDFTYDEIAKLCIGLQTNINPSIRQSIFNSLKQITSKQLNIPSYTRSLLELEKLTEDFLHKNNIDKSNCEKFEAKLPLYFHETIFEKRIIPINLLEVIHRILKTKNSSDDEKLISILCQYAENNLEFPIDLLETLFEEFQKNQLEIFIRILYIVIVQNEQSLSRKFLQEFEKYFLQYQFSSKYTIEILKFLIKRNQFEINRNIIDKLVRLIEHSKENILIETLAYSLENLSISIQLPIERILLLIENSFQSESSTKEMKYYCCLVFNALLTTHQIELSKSIIDVLKTYAHNDDDDVSSKINLRKISLTILKKSLPKNEIEDLINEENISNFQNPSKRLQAAQDLLSMMIQNRKIFISKSQMNIFEYTLILSDSSIEYQLIILKIFQYLSSNLTSSQIELIFYFLNDNQLNMMVVEICKSLVELKRSFSNEILKQLIDFVFENVNRILRDSVIDCLQAIVNYQELISTDLLNKIQWEIIMKNLRDSTIDVKKKKSDINKCRQSVLDQNRLSLNTIDTLEYLLKNSSNLKDIEEEIFDIIESAIRYGQKFPSIFLDNLNRLTSDIPLYRRRIIQIINQLSANPEQQITQDIFDNCQDNINESIDILVKGTQNGYQLSSTIINQLKTILNNPNEHQHYSHVLKLLQNQAKIRLILNDDIIQCLEDHFEINPSIILNILKYLPTYQPSNSMNINIQKRLEDHTFYFQIQNLLNEIHQASSQVKLHFIQIFFTIKYIQFDIEENPLVLLTRQLLCYDLLVRIAQKSPFEKLDQFEFYTNLNAIEKWFSFQSYSNERDEILIFFIENSENFTLKNINHILLLLKTDLKAFSILFNSSSNNCIENLQIHWIYSIIKRYSYIKSNETVQLNDDQAKKILNLLLIELKFNISLSECFLQRIYHVEDFNQLIDFLTYLCEKNVSNSIDFNHYFTRRDSEKIIVKDLYSWLLDIQSNIIKKKLFDLCQESKICENLESIILSIRLNDWSFDIFERLIDILKTVTDQSFDLIIEDFINSLTIINNFGISNQHEHTIESIFKSNKSLDWVKKIHQFVVSVSFDRHEHEKSLQDLINEIEKLNDLEKLNISIETLENNYRQIISIYNSDSKFYPIGKPINNWEENDIIQWSMHYRFQQNQISEKPIFELISVVKRAIFLHNPKQKFEPRTIQILSLLLLLNASDKNLARLAQIKTGEGKSVIIAMFAAIKALHGQQVDIVTTSPLLAKRDAENKKSFYRMLNLTVGDNGGTSTVKSCYKNDVVYGNVNEFQFDILKDRYSLLGTRCGRRFDIAIVDEVDSMLIDDNSKICRLSNKIPAIDELKIILTFIWQELNRTYPRIVRIENKLYCILVPYRIDENGQIILMQTAEADGSGKILESPANDQENFLEIEDPYLFIESHIKNYIENKLLKSNECLISLPKHLNSFVEQQLSKWIFNAWQAKFAYQENIDYLIIEENHGRKSIIPIDYRNTGIIQTNTSWPDGLHQFLQIKHQLRISAENLTTNFLSNVAFFREYKKNLFGLTGTLGTEDAKNLIHHIYDVDFVIIPSYKCTQFIAYPNHLYQLEDDWLNECIKSIYLEAKIHQRAVLVICETKFHATKIYENLLKKDNQLKKSIKLYTRSDNDEQNAIENEFNCGEIIVATNLAGRGTDIGTTLKVEENGGLHVLVTFLPLNTRVEHQAFGRTSRQGKRGTGQLIVLPSMDNEKKYENIEELKTERDLREKHLIDRARDIDLNNIVQRDKLFEKFCDLRHKLRQQENDTFKLDSVEELWGLWLKITFAKQDSMSETITNNLVENRFEEFRSKIIKDYSSNTIFQNPFYLILKANEYIFKMKNYDKAIEFLQYAIQSDPLFSVSARYNLAYALIKKSTDNKAKAKFELQEALKTIDNILISQQQAMLISFGINQNDEIKTKSDAEEQIYNRINLLYLCRTQIEQGISIIHEAENQKHDIKLEYKILDDFFSDINKPTLDINEFKESGFVGFFQLTVKEPTPWLSIIAVGIIGLAQAAAGAAIIAFTAGAAINIGSMLLSEGVNDMIFAIKCGIAGEFSWKEYGIQKMISLAITIATCGLGALKETGQLIKSGFKGCVNVIKTATVGGTQLIGQFTKESWKLVGKQIVHAFAKQGVKEVIKTVLDKTILAELSERINKEISDNIEGKVNEEVNRNQTIHQCLAIDAALNRPNAHCQEIEKITHRILHPQNNRFIQAAITIANGILNRLTDGKSGRLFQIITAGKCLTELVNFLENFLIEFKEELEKFKDQMKIDYLLHSNRSNDVDKRTAKEITESLKKDHYVDKDNLKVLKQLEYPTFKLNKHQNHENYVMIICNNIYVHTETRKQSEYDLQKNLITKMLTIQLANYMTNRLNAELINPVVHTGVDATVNSLSNKIERACADSRGTLEERIQKRRAQNDIIKKGELLRKQTDKQQNKDEIIHPEIENLARSVENGTPGDLKDIIALSAKLGCPIQIYRNGQYDLTIGDTNSGDVLTINFDEGQTGDIGHYTGTNGNKSIPVTGATDCLFDTLSAQTGKSTNELRELAAAGIRENSDIYFKMMPSLHFLGENPDRSLLYIGGKNIVQPRARNHSADDILDDRYLPSRKKLLNDLENLQKALDKTKKAQSKTEKNDSEIERELVLKTLIHDIKDENINKLIAHDKTMRHIFYDSINRRLAYFRETNKEFLIQSDEIRQHFDNAASYWKNNTRPQGEQELFYSQANVNANFSSCNSAEAIDFLPEQVRKKITNQRVDTAGKEAIQTFGPAVCPVQFFRYNDITVAIDNRMLLAHNLAERKPLRLIPTIPSGTELGRMTEPGMPSKTQPRYDKNN